MDSQPQQQVIQLGYEKRRELPGAGEAAIPRLGEGRYLKLPVGGGERGEGEEESGDRGTSSGKESGWGKPSGPESLK